MAVPAEIRAVPRPKNTIVEDSGRDGSKRYSVRERSYCKYVPGGNPQPHNGKVIGHIIDMKYVPVHGKEPEAPAGPAVPDELSYGACALVKSVAQDIKEELLDIYDPSDVFAMMSIATLRVIKPGITAGRMSTEYHRTFACMDYPGAAMSQNSIGKLFQRLGMEGRKRRSFYQKRMDAVAADHHVVIDGTLKQDNSSVNDLSAYSRKARVRGCKEVSVLYAYDIEKMEPVCAEVFPGNCIDASAFPAFIRDNDIRKGIIVADKGFPPNKIETELKERPDLHFISPLRRNDKRIAANDMLSFDGIIPGIAAKVAYRKRRIKGGRYLYSFKETGKASAEMASYFAGAKRKGTLTPEDYTRNNALFGVIVLESDLDLNPGTVYSCYEDRWLIELVFRRYKSDECLDHTDVQNDFSVIGSEFINFISTVLTCRIIRKAEAAGLFEKMTYGELMDDLSSAWRRTDAPAEAVTGDAYWVHTLKVVYEELEALGLSIPQPKPEPKKRGRKPKPKDPMEQKPKRPRGRPRKVTAPPADSL